MRENTYTPSHEMGFPFSPGNHMDGMSNKGFPELCTSLCTTQVFFFELYSRGDPHCGSILKIIKISKKLYKAWGWHDPH
jgi:hypothetical protein